MRGFETKNCGLHKLKGDTYTKKMRPIESILVNLRGCSFVLNISKKPYFIILSYFVVIQYFTISFISIALRKHPKLFQKGIL